MTGDKRYAVLYLPEDRTIYEVFDDEEMERYIPEMSPDYYVRTTETDALGNELFPVRPNYRVTDTLYSDQSYLDYVNLSDTWNVTRGRGITVAIIDTGIDTDSPEFAGRISEYSYNTSEDKTVKNYGLEVIEDENGHGTAVASVLAAGMDGSGVVGIAPEVELLVIKCADDNGSLKLSDTVFGLAYAIERGADIVSMSFGGPSNLYEAYTQLAVDSDIICIASAGNDSSAMLTYPAADPNVIGVGALDGWTLADYSNYGDNSELLAPGSALVAKPGGDYEYAQGTSIACPIVAGAAALYLSQNPRAEFSEVEAMLQASSIDLGPAGEDWENGFGALDVWSLVCGEKGQVTYEMLTDEVENTRQYFVKGRNIQRVPEPERDSLVLDGWFYDVEKSDELGYYTDIFTHDLTLYANWMNEDDSTAYIYTSLPDGTVELRSYTGKRRYLTVPSVLAGQTVSGIGDSCFADNSRLRTVTLPETVTYIGQSAFRNVTGLRSMDIPEAVTRIGLSAFDGCINLLDVNIRTNSRLQSIGTRAFASCGIQSFFLPDGLSGLGSDVFFGSGNLRRVSVAAGNGHYRIIDNALYDTAGSTLIYYPSALSGAYTVPEGTSLIARSAFAYSRSERVTIPEGVTVLGEGAFRSSWIQSLSIPRSVKELGQYLCARCTELTSLTLAGGGFETIPQYAFSGCSSLNSVAIPQQVRTISAYAFYCSGLQTVSFADGSLLSEIGSSAFAYTPLSSIELPSGLKTIKLEAFLNDLSLTDLTLPDSLTVLGDRAFFGSGLEEVSIGAGLLNIGAGAFSGCGSLQAIHVSEGNPNYCSSDGVLYDRAQAALLAYPGARRGVFALPDTVETVGAYAFSSARGLTGVTLNAGLRELGGSAFSGCTSLTSVLLPDSLVTIGESAFSGCSSLSGSLEIPKNVLTVGRYAFLGDYQLTGITIAQDSVMDRLGYGAFMDCGIRNFTVPNSIQSIGQSVFSGCRNLTSVTFEAGSRLDYLPAWVFSGCNQLTEIRFAEGGQLSVIEAQAFQGLTALQKIDLSACTNLLTVDNYAFSGCARLQQVLLPESLREIGRYAFSGCLSLRALTLPASIECIGRYAFQDTSEGMNAFFTAAFLPAGLEENWDSGLGAYHLGVAEILTSGEWTYALSRDGKASILGYSGSASKLVLTDMDGHEIQSIGAGAFRDNLSLRRITLPLTLRNICSAAFRGTGALESIVIPASVQSINDEAFMESGLTSVTFAAGSELTALGRYAFAETQFLRSISIPAGVDRIRDYSFYSSGVQHVEFAPGSALREIGRYAFADSALMEISLPDTVEKIDYYAFSGALQLTEAALGACDGLMLYGHAFYGSGLQSISIPAGVRYIGEMCFSGCQELTAFTVSESNANYCAIDGVLFNKSGTRLVTFPAGRSGTYTIADTVATLEVSAFEGSLLNEIRLTDSSRLITLGYRAFYDCDQITSFYVPAGVVSIDFYAFSGCDRLETVTVSENSQLSGIYGNAFSDCRRLTDFFVPDTVLEIGDCAFRGCSAMNDLHLGENSQLRTVGDHAFEYARITRFAMPEMLEEIGDSAFRCSGLEELVFNDSIRFIEDFAFAGSALIHTKQLVIPGSLEYLGARSLLGASGIEELTLPGNCLSGKTVRDLFSDLEPNSYNLEDIHSVSNVKKITVTGETDGLSASAFRMLPGLEELILPDGDTNFRIVDGVLYNRDMTALLLYPAGRAGTSFTVPQGVTSISDYAFYCCDDLSSVVLPDGLTTIGESAFLGCSQLENAALPDSVTTIGGHAFSGCSQRLSLTTPGGMTVVSPSAFAICPANRVTISDTVTRIGSGAFFNCRLGEITIPASVRRIDNSAFQDCHYLETVFFAGDAPVFDSTAFSHSEFTAYYPADNPTWTESVLQDYGGTVAWKPISEYSETAIIASGTDWGYSWTLAADGTLTVTEGSDQLELSFVTSGHESLVTKLVIASPDITSFNFLGITEYPRMREVAVCPENNYLTAVDGVLYDKAMTTLIWYPERKEGSSFTVPDSVRQIGVFAFGYCSELESVVLPEGVESIMVYAFKNCSALKSITLPASLKTIDGMAFQDCDRFTDFAVAENSPYFRAVDGVLYSRDMSTLVFCPAGKTDGSFRIPDGVTALSNNAFYGSTRLTRIELPDSLRSIGSYAFNGCRNLASIRLPNGLRSLGHSAFSGCTSLAGITIPDSVVELGDMVFADCAGLSRVVLPEGITKIGQHMFSECSSLSSFVIPEGVTEIGEGAFYDCINLAEITIPEGVTKIGHGAFSRCYSLKSVKLPESLISLGSSVFFYDYGLNDINIPDGVTSIPEGTFKYCRRLKSITLPASLSSIGEGAFEGSYLYQDIDIYYGSSKESWESITIGSRNEDLDYAKRHYIAGFDVRYDANGGVGGPLVQTWKAGWPLTVSKKQPTRPGHLFLGWAADPNAAAAEFFPGKTYRSAERNDLTLYAVWQPNQVTITKQPVSLTAESGDYVSFTLKATGENLRYQWQYWNGTGWANTGDDWNSGTDTMSFRTWDGANGLCFRCVVWNAENGEDWAFSDTVSLTVTPAAPVKITRQPTSVTAKDGDYVNFTLKATGKNLRYQWQYWNGTGWANTGDDWNSGTDTMSFRTWEGGNGLCFRCVVWNANNGADYAFSDTVSLTVTPANPVTITRQPVSVTAKAGDKVSYSVEATGDNLRYQWQYWAGDGWANTGDDWNSATSTMSFQTWPGGNGLFFRCVIWNEKNGADYAFSVTVGLTVTSANPVTITRQPVSVTAASGDYVSYSLAATGENLCYQWQYWAGDGWANTGDDWNSSTSTMSFWTWPEGSGLSFRCVIWNANNGADYAFSDTVGLTVKPKDSVTITRQPVSVTARDGSYVSYHVEAAGKNLRYQWQYWDGQGWSNTGDDWNSGTDTMIFQTWPGGNGLSFRCVVWNALNGEDWAFSDTVSLTVY
ncbi:MAG: leucine-rich repeat protein [Oscillospiraceae bacterium]|nr:leucine-rich repeat protein [Oscillospiraceae bacterium]